MNKSWIFVIEADKIKPNHYEEYIVGFTSLIIGNSNNRYFALENVCSHDGGELAGGELVGEEIICPRHGAGFCIHTGAVTRAPAYEGIRQFPLRVREGKIEIQI